MERNSKKEFIINVLYGVIVFLMIFAVYYITVKFLLPFVIGGVIAYTVQKPAKKLSEKLKLSQGVWSVILALALYAVVGSAFCFLIYRLIISAFDFSDYLPAFFEKIKGISQGLGNKYANFFAHFPEEIREMMNVFFNNTFKNLSVSFGNVITSLVSGFLRKIPFIFISGIVTLVASCYISKDFVGLKKFVKLLMGKRIALKTVKIKNILIGSVFKILKSYLLLCTITAIELYLGFLLLGISNALLLAIVIALVDILPVLGSGTVIIPWAVIAVISGDLKLGIGLAILYLVITVIRNFSEPKILGAQLGVNSLFTLIAMFLGLKILGFWGLILFPIILIVTIKYYKDEMKEGLSE